MKAAYLLGQQQVSSEAFYAAACNPERAVVVEACAGAGKTWMLVSRILRALLHGALPQQILAITFTRKAAGEMRSRLDAWLLAFSDAHSSSAEREQALRDRGCSVDEARALAPQLGGLHEQVLRSGRSVDVRTFLSWFAQLTQHAPITLLDQLGLPAAYEPIEDTAPLRGALFSRFHRSVQAEADLRVDYMALVARHRRSVVLQWLEVAWQRGPELQRADQAGHADGAVPSAAMFWPACAAFAEPAQALQQGPLAIDLDQLARQLGAVGKVKTGAAAQGLRAALDAADAASAFSLAWDALFTKAGEPRKQLGDGALQLHVVAELQLLRSQGQQQQAHEDHQALLRLSRVLLAEYAQLKRDRGLVDMADLERVAEALLGDSDAAGWVQERLDQRLRHLLIDEFQDTSPLQWQVLHSWLSSYAGAGGGASGQRPPAVFIVGDPKQSIYRFRGAEPRVFVAARDFVQQGLHGQLLQCDHTRRNAASVIDAVNVVFDDAQRLDDWGPFRAHTTSSSAHGSVCRLPGVLRAAVNQRGAAEGWRDSLTQARDEPEQHLRAEEAAQAARAVAALIGEMGMQPGEIMVLARKRSVLGWVADALAQLGLPHVVAEPLLLQESPEALDLVAVLDVLASPGHNIALARALKSPLFGADDNDLLWLAQAAREGAPGTSWRQLLLTAARLPTPALQRAQNLLALWVPVADHLPPHDLLDRIVHQGDVLARVAAAVPASRRAGALHAISALLAAALQHQGGRFTSLYSFVRALRAGRVQARGAAPSAAVQLLTVHGAKGLEARAVVVMDSDPELRPARQASLLIDWPVDAPVPLRVAFVRSEAQPPPSLVALCQAEAAARAREELNSLYVAMTRAREWLVFSRTEPRTPATGRPWWARVERAAEQWQPEDVRGDATAPTATTPVPTLPALRWQRAAAESAAGAANATHAARLGQAVHRVLEWAGQPAAPMPRQAWAAACAAAAQSFGLQRMVMNAAQQVQHIVQQILDSPSCAGFFGGPALRWAGNEVPVSSEGDAGNEPLRIDRLVLLDDGQGPATWWVLDYKLNSRPAQTAAYREQMQRYVAAVQALQPADIVRGAFITGLGEVVPV
jgi:ATP-dependent helicase/nuclease subunit A